LHVRPQDIEPRAFLHIGIVRHIGALVAVSLDDLLGSALLLVLLPEQP
jgi:hypothetical protein